MTRQKGERPAKWPWNVPLAAADVPDEGLHLDLEADEAARAAIAKFAGLRALPRLAAAFDVTPRGNGGLHVVGRLSATVGQDCVVTLEPVDNEVAEDIDLDFTPDGAVAGVAAEDDDAPEPLRDGAIDLGAIATEFLLLGIDPYPRKAGAMFEPPAQPKGGPHPFAALAALKKGRGQEGG
jgi:hypothetical protein